MAERFAKLFVAGILIVLAAACGGDNPDAVLEVEASIDGVPISESGAGNPQPISPDVESELSLEIRNISNEPVDVGHVRLEGEVLGLTFMTYDARAGVVVAPGETRSLEVPIEFFDIGRQAHGYLRTWIRLYGNDADRTRLSSDEFATDVRGDVTSTMGIFAGLLFLFTVYSLVMNLRAMRRRQLPANRFKRGVRLALTGLGLGLLLSVAFSVLRIFPLPAAGWVPLTLLPTAIGFGLGYIAPGFLDDDAEDLDDDADDFALRETAKLR